MTTTKTTAETVAQVRKHFSAARAMNRNLRLGHYQGRNGGGSAAVTHEREAAKLARTLGRELEGMLWAEHQLAERISLARDMGQERPELRERMTRYRRELRLLLAA